MWQGRISDRAADSSLRMYEAVFLAFMSAILGMIAFVVAMTVGEKLAAVVFVCLVYASAAAFLIRGLLYGRAAGRDIARQYGLPAGSWRRMKIKTPEQFDRWLKSYKRT